MELGLFDPEWYRRVHSDVSMHGMDPFKHYLRHGWLERRNASPLMGEDFLGQVFPDGIDSGRNPVIEILSRIRRGEFSEDALRQAMDLQKRMPECTARLIKGVTVAGFFGRSNPLGEMAFRLVEILDQAEIPCSLYNVFPLEGISKEKFSGRCRQVMDRQAAIFLVDESASRWAVNHLRPGRLNVLIPCGEKGLEEWKHQTEGFDEIWVGDLGREIEEMGAGQQSTRIRKIGEIIRKNLQGKGIL